MVPAALRMLAYALSAAAAEPADSGGVLRWDAIVEALLQVCGHFTVSCRLLQCCPCGGRESEHAGCAELF